MMQKMENDKVGKAVDGYGRLTLIRNREIEVRRDDSKAEEPEMVTTEGSVKIKL
jgi:hypothetical protein